MAAITGSRDHQRIDDRHTLIWRHDWAPTVATASLILAAAFLLGPLWIGVAVAGLFVIGNAVAAAEGRSLRADEFALISALHVAATVALVVSA